MRNVSRALSSIFCLGQESISEKFLEPRSGKKIFFRACKGVQVACSHGKFRKHSVQDWLKSHFWTLVTFTDSLISSSNKISI